MKEIFKAIGDAIRVFHLQFASIVSFESWGSAKLQRGMAGICSEHLSNDGVILSTGVGQRTNLQEKAESP